MAGLKGASQALGGEDFQPSTDHQASEVPEQRQDPDNPLADMPPGTRLRSNAQRREADLSSVLNPTEKVELTALVTRVTDTMQHQLTRPFDPAPTGDKNETLSTASWGRLPYHLKDLSLDDPFSPLNTIKTQPSQPENLAPPRPKKVGRARDKRNAAAAPAAPAASEGPKQDEEEVIPLVPELRKETLAHFKKWQGSVHRRIGEITVKKAQHNGSASAGQRGRMPPNRKGKSNGPKTTNGPGINLQDDPVLMQLFPPVSTTLTSLSAEKRCLILHAMLLLLLSMENYGAYARVFLQYMASALQVPLHVVIDDETRVCEALAQMATDIPPELLVRPKNEDGKPVRRWRTGLIAAPAGVSPRGGGIATALEVARIGSVFGVNGIPVATAASLLGIMGENSLSAGSLFGIYTSRHTGKTMEHYLKDVGDFAFLPLRGSTGEGPELGKVKPDSRRLRVVLGISGWLPSKDKATSPWECLGDQSEVYAVQWEIDALCKLGGSFDILVRSVAWSMTKKEIISRPNGPRFSLSNPQWPASLLRISKIIDNNWCNAMVRADKLGSALADVLISKAQGERGVSLIGFSLGARAIYSCLMCLAEKRAFGLVENAIMMGTPAPSDAFVWCTMKSVVSGRLVNVYSEGDYILGFLYRTCSLEFGLAGVQRIPEIEGIENVDVTAEVSIHPRYQYLVGSILRHIGWDDTDGNQISRDEADMSSYEDLIRQHEERRDAVEAAKVEVKKEDENDPSIIRTRMRKKNRK
ncbi:uncharacterized protein C8A04DRAFT_14225 [Dichotomopilus funicola]|uniref:Uncharacterized protein n=1 Tax=Dichotomopilus funicola TaxID=1934379 RepID=A0AAN6UY58_9PEZI|nr:hypothetical protein C8A04DRAFT_14225 [Dichotomopilus funicola]